MSNTQQPTPDDPILIVDDRETAASAAPSHSWRVLIVDDDDEVHASTRFALRDVIVLDRPLELIHAYSADEAWQRIEEYPGIAVAFIDVVMERPDAGLCLVKKIREAGYEEMRIVLRTGQPGYAPEISVISTYEIDDYRTKDELTQTRLLTVLTAAIRAFDQITRISHSRTGLEMIVESTNELFQRTNLELLSRGVLTQIASFLRVSANGLVSLNPVDGEIAGESQIISAMGRFGHLVGKPLAEVEDPKILEFMKEAQELSAPVLKDGYMAFNFSFDDNRNLSALIEADFELAREDLALLKLFSTNITMSFENLALIEKLDKLAYIDPVLEISNLNAFEAALESWPASHGKQGHMALMGIDLFGSIVAAYGLGIAHKFLQAVHQRLVEIAGAPLTIARIGDSTFALLGTPEVLNQALIPAAFASPFQVNGIEIVATATAVILDLAKADVVPASIMRMASSALQHVRRVNRGACVIYDSATRADVERRIALQVALKDAVEQGAGLAVHLQPKFSLITGEIVGAEALLRWQHGDQAISPAEFIPIAESSGLTQPLTEFVVDTVGRWTIGLNGSKPLPIAINLSMADLNTPNFANELLSRALDAGLTPKTLQFEVTEGIAMQNTPWALEQTQALRDAGFRIALDDFGTGYSSLASFDQLPIDTLKIDRSFVSRLNVRTARHSLAATILAMAQALDVECVAEGIETVEQNQALIFLGCTVGQGFLFGHPVPIDDFKEHFLGDAAN